MHDRCRCSWLAPSGLTCQRAQHVDERRRAGSKVVAAHDGVYYLRLPCGHAHVELGLHHPAGGERRKVLEVGSGRGGGRGEGRGTE